MTAASAAVQTGTGSSRQQRHRRAIRASALVVTCLAFTPGCWGYLAHEVSPESVTDPKHEFEMLIRTSTRPPLSLNVQDEFVSFTSYFGTRTIYFARLGALEIRTQHQRYLVDLFDVTNRRVLRLEEPDEASARRLCDVLSALHARAIHPIPAPEAHE